MHSCRKSDSITRSKKEKLRKFAINTATNLSPTISNITIYAGMIIIKDLILLTIMNHCTFSNCICIISNRYWTRKITSLVSNLYSNIPQEISSSYRYVGNKIRSNFIISITGRIYSSELSQQRIYIQTGYEFC